MYVIWDAFFIIAGGAGLLVALVMAVGILEMLKDLSKLIFKWFKEIT